MVVKQLPNHRDIPTTGITGNGRIATWYRGDDRQDQIYAHTVMYMDMPATQNMCSYVVRCTASWGGSIRDLYINDRDSNDMERYFFVYCHGR